MQTLDLPAIEMSVWMPLLGSGIGVAFTPGTTLKSYLGDRLKIGQDYLEHRIQTILVNSSPIDDVDRAVIMDGDVIALSAAMPGLVGTTLRRGSHLSAMRRDITQDQDRIAPKSNGSHINVMTLKLFNMVAAEVGPRLLTGQILLKENDLSYLRRHYPALSLEGTPTTGPDDWIEVHLPDQG